MFQICKKENEIKILMKLKKVSKRNLKSSVFVVFPPSILTLTMCYEDLAYNNTFRWINEKWKHNKVVIHFRWKKLCSWITLELIWQPIDMLVFIYISREFFSSKLVTAFFILLFSLHDSSRATQWRWIYKETEHTQRKKTPKKWKKIERVYVYALSTQSTHTCRNQFFLRIRRNFARSLSGYSKKNAK